MRGLTRDERRLLQARVADAPRVLDYPGSPGYRAAIDLIKSGRLTERLVANPESLTGHARRTSITDLGRLALRVCPPEES